MKKLVLVIIGTLAYISFVYSQNEVDALRYSFNLPGGTARSNAMAGSFGALGGDAYSLGFNPAGMGIYKSSEFTFTPSFEIINSEASYLGKNRSDFDFGVNLNNIAYIGTISGENDNNFNIGFSYNRLNSFNENTIIEGVNERNSITDWFAANGRGIRDTMLSKYDNFYSNLAYWTYLINPINADLTMYASDFANYGETQRQTINRSGYQGEYNFSISGSIERKLFLGATLGIQSVRFKEVKTLQETDPNNVISDFNSLTFKEHLSTKGSGINFKFGILYSPIEWLRFGAAIHTPTFFNLKDEFKTSLSSNFENANKSKQENSYNGYFDYELNTPMKANASVGFILDKVALVNIDYEIVSYSKARLRGDDYSFSDENDNIMTKYKPAHNVRIGGEYRYGPLSFRLGGAYYSSPYESTESNKSAYTLLYSLGIGTRFGNSYFDVAYSYLDNSNYYGMYGGFGETIDSPLAKITKNQNRISATLGFKF